MKRTGMATAALAIALLPAGPVSWPSQAAAEQAASYDILIRNGMIYDGSGSQPFRGEVGIKGDRIAAVGRSLPGTAKQIVDAKGLAVAPGFINMLSWATESVLIDGLGQSDLRQGVTLEVWGRAGRWARSTTA